MKLFYISCITAVALCASSFASAETDHYCRAPAKVADVAQPMNYPDQYAWKLFVEVNKQAKVEKIKVKGKTLTLNNAYWETWVDDVENFPAHPNPAKPPQWPTKANGHKLINASFSAHQLSQDGKKITANAMGEASCQLDQGTCEVVYRNKTTFEYIINNKLWYQEGIATFFASGQQVVFPIDSIEVKANWKIITEQEKAAYHWNYTEDGQLIGLVAMHISSKVIPNWLWATFEHADNPGRCDLLGCYDCYGTSTTAIPANTSAFGGQYPAGTLTPALLKNYKDAGYKGTWLKAWQNYRLKGSMVNFTDSYGNPNLLGNSVTESGFVATSSCMGCHSRAAVTAQGAKAFPVFGELPSSVATQAIPAEYGYQFLTVNGTPNPADFYHRAGNIYQNNPNGILKLMQTDFVWAIPMRAQRVSPK
jgi:hypothetical protein